MFWSCIMSEQDEEEEDSDSVDKYRIKPSPPRRDLSSVSDASSSTKEGRWTAEEHLLFLEGLQKYDKSWRDIATIVKTRTPDQIRTHAQKYFIKMGKVQGTKNGPIMMDGRRSRSGSSSSKSKR